MKPSPDEVQPAPVPEGATQAGEASVKDWNWVKRQVWTERMLEALAKGVKGGAWFSLIRMGEELLQDGIDGPDKHA